MTQALKIITGPHARQGTPEWRTWRHSGLGGSDAPVVMGRSLWSTPYRLWRQKVGLDDGPALNPAMLRGIRLEPKARAAYEQATGELVVPMVGESLSVPILRASFDGLGFDHILEIKCPGAKAHAMALQGLVPDYYADQLQQQMFVAGVDLAHYWSYDGEQGTLIEVKRDQARIDQLVEESIRFWERVQSRRWESDEWQDAATAWRLASAALEAVKAEEEAARKSLLSLFGAEEAKREGAGVIVTRAARKGSVDYEAVMASQGVVITKDVLETHRKAGTSVIQVREAANATPLEELSLRMPQAPGKEEVSNLDLVAA